VTRARRCLAALISLGLALAALGAGLAGGGALHAEEPRPDPLREVGFDQKLGGLVPLDATFADESGRAVRLGDYFGKKPVLLHLVYFDCPMLCGMATDGLLRSLRPLGFTAGKEFDILTVSFDPREKPALAAAKKKNVIAAYGREGAAAGWHFLTGEEEAIARLTGAVGFRYVWDAEAAQFSHATGIVALTPVGRISKYFFGIEYAPKDLRLGLVEAATERIGSLVDSLLLLCYRYDPRMGRYTMVAVNFLRGGAVLTVVVLGGFIVLMLRRERKARGA
jgi:protein SCO1/2